ncbi:hypothetical protein [Tsuneonella deserti]|nr:hypothetical protein [Tsuneonella deserti]
MPRTRTSLVAALAAVFLTSVAFQQALTVPVAPPYPGTAVIA